LVGTTCRNPPSRSRIRPETSISDPGGASSSQPSVWTFVDFEAPDESADQIADALAYALLADHGWWADFIVGNDHVVVFASKVFRYRIGDNDGRQEASSMGSPHGRHDTSSTGLTDHGVRQGDDC
jgi:hypothetical protein